MIITISTVSLTVLILNSIYLTNSIKEFLHLTFLIDTLFLTSLIASLGFIPLYFQTRQGSPIEIYWMLMAFLNNLFFAANVRIYLKNVSLRQWQIILLKITIAITTVTYFLGVDYRILIDYKITNGFDPEIDKKIN